MSPYVALLVSYVVGSIPSAYLAGKARGIDLRQHGSGNLGATNVYRVLGAPIAAVVWLVDTLKGWAPVYFLPAMLTAGSTARPDHWAYAFGLAAILGHVRPVFLLGQKGGKGVATAGGVFLALAPLAMLVAMLTFVLVVTLSGYVSLGSLVAAVALVVTLAATKGLTSPVTYVGLAVALFVFWSHRANIGRLRRGEEHRFGKKKAPAAGADTTTSTTAGGVR